MDFVTNSLYLIRKALIKQCNCTNFPNSHAQIYRPFLITTGGLQTASFKTHSIMRHSLE